jgi:hypothetical protein
LLLLLPSALLLRPDSAGTMRIAAMTPRDREIRGNGSHHHQQIIAPTTKKTQKKTTKEIQAWQFVNSDNTNQRVHVVSSPNQSIADRLTYIRGRGEEECGVWSL